jgi:hypothetical protein
VKYETIVKEIVIYDVKKYDDHETSVFTFWFHGDNKLTIVLNINMENVRNLRLCLIMLTQ